MNRVFTRSMYKNTGEQGNLLCRYSGMPYRMAF